MRLNPVFRHPDELGPVVEVHPRHLSVLRIRRLGGAEEGLEGEHGRLYGQGGGPLIFQYILYNCYVSFEFALFTLYNEWKADLWPIAECRKFHFLLLH